MDFHAFDDLLRIHSNTGQSLRVVTADGTVSQDTDLQAPGGLNPPQVIGTAYANNYVGGVRRCRTWSMRVTTACCAIRRSPERWNSSGRVPAWISWQEAFKPKVTWT